MEEAQQASRRGTMPTSDSGESGQILRISRRRALVCLDVNCYRDHLYPKLRQRLGRWKFVVRVAKLDGSRDRLHVLVRSWSPPIAVRFYLKHDTGRVNHVCQDSSLSCSKTANYLARFGSDDKSPSLGNISSLPPYIIPIPFHFRNNHSFKSAAFP